MPNGSMLCIPPTNLLLLADKQEPYKKVYLLTKNIEDFSGKSSGEWTRRQKKDETDRVAGLGRSPREEIVKWNQMTALRFQTGGDIRHPGLPSGETSRKETRRQVEQKQQEDCSSSRQVGQTWRLSFNKTNGTTADRETAVQEDK